MSHSHQCQRCLKLVSASGVHTCTPTKLVRDLEQKLEAAEARIKASQEQEPVAWVWKFNDDQDDAWTENDWRLSLGPQCPTYREECESRELYAAPVIPPDVAEVQRENAELRDAIVRYMRDSKRLVLSNSELTRKLAEHQAAHRMLYEIYFDGKMPAGFTPEEELTKLLAEAKSTAVPEGWKHKRMTNIPHPHYDGMRVIGWIVPAADTAPFGMVSEAIERILFAPQPETDRGSNE